MAGSDGAEKESLGEQLALQARTQLEVGMYCCGVEAQLSSKSGQNRVNIGPAISGVQFRSSPISYSLTKGLL